jgi:hypothetical protein
MQGKIRPMQQMWSWLRVVLLTGALGAGVAGCNRSSSTVPPSPLNSSITNLEGRPVDPFASAGRRATVLLFITNDCPISNAYAPEIHRLCDAYMPQRVDFYLVYADPALSAADARKHYQDYGYTCSALLDPRHLLARKAGATVTPEAAVFLPDGREIYRGRIDDLYIDYGKARFTPTTRDLRDVLELVAHDRPVEGRTTVAVGCHIPD